MLFENWTSPLNAVAKPSFGAGRDVVNELQHRAAFVVASARIGEVLEDDDVGRQIAGGDVVGGVRWRSRSRKS